MSYLQKSTIFCIQIHVYIQSQSKNLNTNNNSSKFCIKEITKKRLEMVIVIITLYMCSSSIYIIIFSLYKQKIYTQYIRYTHNQSVNSYIVISLCMTINLPPIILIIYHSKWRHTLTSLHLCLETWTTSQLLLLVMEGWRLERVTVDCIENGLK